MSQAAARPGFCAVRTRALMRSSWGVERAPTSTNEAYSSADRNALARCLWAVAAALAPHLVFVALLVGWPTSTRAQPVVVPGQVARITQAELCRTMGLHDAIPDATCNWKTVALPTAWKPLLANTEPSDAWFKLQFRLRSVPQEGIALYATTLDRSGRVFVNGLSLGPVDSMEEPLPLNWNRAHFLVLPSSLLHEGLNELELQERQYGDEYGRLSALDVGTEHVLRPRWERRVFWQNSVVEFVTAAMAVMGAVLLCVWLLRRSETSYFWFGWTCWVWTLHNADFFIRYSHMPQATWEKLMLVLNTLRAIVMYMFILRYSHRRWPRVEALLWVYFCVGAAAVFVSFFPGGWVSLWYLLPLLATLYFGSLLVLEGFRRNVWEGSLFAIAAVSEILLSAHDAWIYGISGDVEPFFLAQYVAPLYVMVVGFSLIRHFVASMSGIERQNALTQRALDEARKATKDKSLFFSMVSHELKSPLQTIVTVLAAENQRAAGRERRQSLEKIGRAVKYMEAQIRDLFVLSIAETAKLEMRSETFEVGDLVREVVSSVADLAAGKSVDVRVEPVSDYLFVVTDPKRVEQVLLNIVENAVKYTKAGTVTIEYSLEQETWLRIRVSDTGVGIPKEHIDKLFAPYRRFALLDREHNSLGIGLTVVQTLLTHLGGTCDVQSTPGAGSTFTIRIPVAVEKEGAELNVSPDTVRLLIVDDRPEMLADLEEVATTLGYYVDTAESAPLASNVLAISKYDVVLIDLDMPVKNGFELASEIRRSAGPNSETCLVAISAGDPNAQGLEMPEAMWPFDSFEQKPIDARTMKRIVESRARMRAQDVKVAKPN